MGERWGLGRVGEVSGLLTLALGLTPTLSLVSLVTLTTTRYTRSTLLLNLSTPLPLPGPCLLTLPA